MANFLQVLELPDGASIVFFGAGLVLTVVEEDDKGAIYTGAQLAATEAKDSASFATNVITQNIELAAIEAPDIPAIDVLSGNALGLHVVEVNDIASFHIYESLLLEVQANEQPDLGSIDILQGFLAEIAGVEEGDTGIVVFSANTLAELAAIEDSDYGTIFAEEIPVTFVRKTIVMHLFNYSVSEYKNYNFNCLLHFNQRFIGLNEQGIYLLDGDDDLGEPIQAEIRDGVRDLSAKGAIAIPREAWLSYRSNDGMRLDIKVDEVKDLHPVIFSKVAQMVRECRRKFGRGIRGKRNSSPARFITWDLKNLNGSDFDLESLRIMGDLIKRKTR
jgi:hypothetical protein